MSLSDIDKIQIIRWIDKGKLHSPELRTRHEYGKSVFWVMVGARTEVLCRGEISVVEKYSEEALKFIKAAMAVKDRVLFEKYKELFD